MKTNKTTPDKKRGGLKSQPGKEDIQNVIRPHVNELIAKALHIAQHGDSDSNKIGAIKLLLSKVVPDMKATELSTDERTRFIFQIVKDTTLEDANKKDPAKDKELPSSGSDIQSSS